MNEVERLADLCVELGLDESALDDAVYDCACGEPGLNACETDEEQEDWICEAEQTASSINNGGFEAQLEYLLEHNNTKWLESRICEYAATKGE